MPVPMNPYSSLYLAFSCLFSAGFDFAVGMLVFRIKRNRTAAVLIFAVICLAKGMPEFLETPHTFESSHFTHAPLYSACSAFISICLLIGYICYFTKGHPARNFLIFTLASWCFFIPMVPCKLIRKLMGWTPLMYASSASEFQDCVLELAAYTLAFFLVRLLLRMFGARLARLPARLCWLLVLLDFCILEFPWYPIFTGNDTELFVGGIAATINLGLACFIPFSFFLLIALFCFTISEARIAAKKKSLLLAEMEIQYSYYQELHALQRPIRELRHDLANHLAVMEQFRQNRRQDLLNQYEASLLSLCREIDKNIASSIRRRRLKISGLTEREAYVLYICILDLLNRYGRTWEDIRFSEGERHLVLSLLKDRDNALTPGGTQKASVGFLREMAAEKGGRKAALQRALKKDRHFQLIRSILKDHKWTLVLEEDADSWNFTLNF